MTVPQRDCPEAEELAAFAEGVAMGDREALVRHLRSCSDCVESYAAALALLDHDARDPGDRSTPPRSWGVWVALAAALLLGAGVTLLLRLGTPSPASYSSAWEATRAALSALPNAPADARFAPWPAGGSSGFGFAPSDTLRQGIRMGVRVADVEWAARRHPAESPDVRAAMRSEPDTPGVDLDTLIESGKARDELALGWTLEWCRLAAQARLTGACPNEGSTRWSLVGDLQDPAAKEAWDEVRRHLREASSAPGHWTDLEAALTRLIELIT